MCVRGSGHFLLLLAFVSDLSSLSSVVVVVVAVVRGCSRILMAVGQTVVRLRAENQPKQRQQFE